MTDLTIEEITTRLTAAAAEAAPTGKVIKFDFGEAKPIVYDGSKAPAEVSNVDRDAHATVKMTLKTFTDIANGKENPATALMTGKVKIMGDMTAAMDLQKVMEKARG